MSIDRILQKIEHIPAFPVTIGKVGQLIRDENYEIKDLVDVIEYDQAITANILKMCNSAYFNVRNTISHVRDAVVYLGQDNLIQLILVAGVARFYRDIRGYGISAATLWEHSIGVALMSRILSERFFNRERHELFTAGLLHDIGKIVLGEFVFNSFQKIVDLVTYEKYSFLEAEEAILGMNHAEVGGRIASSWNFPQEIVEIITFHHRPDLARDDNKVNAWIVYLADQACMMMGIGGGTDNLSYRGLDLVMEKFKLTQAEFEECIVRLFEDIMEARDLIRIVESKDIRKKESVKGR